MLCRASFLLLISAAGFAQTFEAASVKPSPPVRPDGTSGFIGGPGSKSPERIDYTFVTMRGLLMRAYSVKTFQVIGPAWIETENYNITAKVPPGTTREELAIMLQKLLAQRFGLVVHRESKEAPVYELVVAKGGPKFKAAAPVIAAPPPGPSDPPVKPQPPRMGPDGFIIVPGAPAPVIQTTSRGWTKMNVRNETMEHFAMMLTGAVGRPVVDKTELKGNYDLVLAFSTFTPAVGSETATADDGPPPLLEAIQSELGLKLEAKKGPVEMLVMDHVDKKPTDN